MLWLVLDKGMLSRLFSCWEVVVCSVAEADSHSLGKWLLLKPCVCVSGVLWWAAGAARCWQCVSSAKLSTGCSRATSWSGLMTSCPSHTNERKRKRRRRWIRSWLTQRYVEWSVSVCSFIASYYICLGRLRVDLITFTISGSQMSVRPSIRPQKVSSISMKFGV